MDEEERGAFFGLFDDIDISQLPPQQSLQQAPLPQQIIMYPFFNSTKQQYAISHILEVLLYL